MWLVIDFAANQYQRCDGKGCDRYDMTAFAGGIYTTVQFNPGSIFKALNDGTQFLEVTTSGTAAHVAHGRCTRSPR